MTSDAAGLGGLVAASAGCRAGTSSGIGATGMRRAGGAGRRVGINSGSGAVVSVGAMAGQGAS